VSTKPIVPVDCSGDCSRSVSAREHTQEFDCSRTPLEEGPERSISAMSQGSDCSREHSTPKEPLYSHRHTHGLRYRPPARLPRGVAEKLLAAIGMDPAESPECKPELLDKIHPRAKNSPVPSCDGKPT
jgi:hypothetical protein